MEATILTLKSFSEFVKNVTSIPEIVQNYISAENHLEGKYFKFVKDGKNENTGDGMSYYDRLYILYQGSKLIYDSGFLLYRPGYAFSTDRYDLCINNVKLLQEDLETAVYGYQNGTGQAFIKKCDKNGNVTLVCSFDLGAREKAIKSQEVPRDDEFFKSWAGRNLPNIGGSSWHYDIYHTSEVQCVVVARHCSRSVDATHDAFKVLIWRRGKGVAISDLYYTGAKTSYSKFSTNYLRGQVSVADNGNIIYSARSQFGDITVEKIFFVEG